MWEVSEFKSCNSKENSSHAISVTQQELYRCLIHSISWQETQNTNTAPHLWETLHKH